MIVWTSFSQHLSSWFGALYLIHLSSFSASGVTQLVSGHFPLTITHRSFYIVSRKQCKNKISWISFVISNKYIFFTRRIWFLFVFQICITCCQVGRGCRIHWLLLCRGARFPQRVSWIWHKTIWCWVSSNAEVLGNAEYPFIAITPWFTLAWTGSTW